MYGTICLPTIMQGVAEFLVSGILGGIVARAVAKFVK